ncbi:MAG TPA: ABC transporter ATP-binding protein [Flavobacteriales bacterium]|nr:ABC transporter ATP-binding protein [Flavobacteriales bacterium]
MYIDFSQRVNEVQRHFNNGDVHLASRRLIDCALDTQSPAIFVSCLQFCDYYDENKESNPGSLVEKANEVLQKIMELQIPVPALSAQVIEVDTLRKAYANGKFRLGDISFSIKRGEIVGLVGENGNGKTSLLRLLAKELKPDHGTINYGFVNENIHPYELRTKLVYIPQRIPRWYGSLMNNLQFTLSSYGIKGEENRLWSEMMVARLGLRPYKHLDWNRISSGYKTRFEIAKNLLRKPHILLLDEPLANLDILAQQTILQDIKHLSQSLTNPFATVLSSQQLFEVEKVSDKVIFLKNGAPKYQDSHAREIEEVVFEMETNASKEELLFLFKSLNISKIVNNGGVLIFHFPAGVSSQAIYREIAGSHFEFNYIRNISRSSRRYFVE